MRFIGLQAACWLTATLGACPVVAATGVPMPAVWKQHHVNFVYMGVTSRYSCDGLSDKVRAMLMNLGARRDLRIVALGCEEFGRPPGPHSISPSLEIRFSAPAVPQAGIKAASPGDLAPVDARFESFTIAADAFRNMGVGDCELVEEFARQILPKLSTRDVEKEITCVPYQLSGSRYYIHGQILRALSPAEQSALGKSGGG